jgi:Replication protein C N-terminal domain
MLQFKWRSNAPVNPKLNRPSVIGDSVKVTRKEALAAVRNVAGILGLNDNDVFLLVSLASLSKASDWPSGQLYYQTVSFDQIASSTGLERGVIDQGLTRLIAARLINVATHSLDGDGVTHGDPDIVAVDLSALAARTAELEWLAEAQEFKQEQDEFDDVTLMSDEGQRAGVFDELSFASGEERDDVAPAPLARATASITTFFQSVFGFGGCPSEDNGATTTEAASNVQVPNESVVAAAYQYNGEADVQPYGDFVFCHSDRHDDKAQDYAEFSEQIAQQLQNLEQLRQVQHDERAAAQDEHALMLAHMARLAFPQTVVSSTSRPLQRPYPTHLPLFSVHRVGSAASASLASKRASRAVNWAVLLRGYELRTHY